MTEQPSQDVAVPEQGVIVQQSAAVSAWDRLMARDHIEVAAPDLAKDDDLDGLTGVDMYLTSATYRPGIIREIEKGKKKQFAYASIEGMICPVQDLRKINRRRVASDLPKLEKLEDLPFSPGDEVVVNDGSTGIYRQITEYLHSEGRITFAVTGDDVVTGGEMGESTYDLPPGDWEAHTGTGDYTDETDYAIRFDFGIRLRGGFRRSVYPNPAKPSEKSVTRYF